MPAIERAEGWTRSADGTVLFWRSWRGAAPRAAATIVHGLGEHSGRYDHVGAFLAERGVDSWAGDCRGHGRSPGPRVHVQDFEGYTEDAGAVLDLAARGGRPGFLVGHSQGGLVALLRALRHPRGLRGVAASSPYLADHPAAEPSPARRALAAVLLRAAPTFLVASGIDTGVLSHDPTVERSYVADPLVSRKVSAAWLRAVRGAQAEVLAAAERFPVPALVMVSADDRLVDPAVTRAWVRRAPAGAVTYVEWPGLFHEMFNEIGRERVLARLAEWISSRLP